jgi:DNA polymerase V
MPQFALVDCNNFYVSCERVFNPALNNKPVVVLSNNDGCIIARSNEAKALDIPMGAPLFEYELFFRKHHVIVYSSNYSLYGDMSARVMATLTQLCPDIEIYSIDEAFLLLDSLTLDNTQAFAHLLRNRIKQWTGIPISIGIGPTKTLAKVANKIAKKQQNLNGVFEINAQTAIDDILKTSDVSDIWGVGRQYTKLLYQYGIKTAHQLKCADDRWIKKRMTICGLRTVHELRGISCISLEQVPTAQQSIACTRSFGQPITELNQLQEALATYAARASQKARAKNLIASALHVFITTGYHAQNSYSNGMSIELMQPTAFTPSIIAAAGTILKQIYKPGYRYKKAGVILLDLISAHHQQNSFLQEHRHEEHKTLMNTIDQLNRKWGRSTVRFAAEGFKKPWRMKQSKKSSYSTTSWKQLPIIKL